MKKCSSFVGIYILLYINYAINSVMFWCNIINSFASVTLAAHVCEVFLAMKSALGFQFFLGGGSHDGFSGCCFSAFPSLFSTAFLKIMVSCSCV